MLNAEMDVHLEQEAQAGVANHRNGSSPKTVLTPESAIKLLWLALRNVLSKSVRRAFDWKGAMNQFAILYGDRFTLAKN